MGRLFLIASAVMLVLLGVVIGILFDEVRTCAREHPALCAKAMEPTR